MFCLNCRVTTPSKNPSDSIPSKTSSSDIPSKGLSVSPGAEVPSMHPRDTASIVNLLLLAQLAIGPLVEFGNIHGAPNFLVL
jgi:hypothetical protein